MKKIRIGLAILSFLGAGALFAAPVAVRGFWGEQYRNLTVNWLPHCVKMMEAGGEGEEMLNFRPTGKFKGCKWADAYPYNVAESICLALEIDPGADADWRAAQENLRATLERWIPQFLSVQEPSGYIDNFTRLNKLPHFTRDGDHEFYVMGYFIELGIAHFHMTAGRDRRLLDAAIRCADHLDTLFGPAPKRTWMNGHPGLELALQRLSKATGDARYAKLAAYFVTHQHTTENKSDYNQAERPAVEMCEAKGHAVRANYFYTAMAQIPETRAAAERFLRTSSIRRCTLRVASAAITGARPTAPITTCRRWPMPRAARGADSPSSRRRSAAKRPRPYTNASSITTYSAPSHVTARPSGIRIRSRPISRARRGMGVRAASAMCRARSSRSRTTCAISKVTRSTSISIWPLRG